MSVPFGKYLLQRKIAEGGMAEIFLARQEGLQGFEKLVVVKRLLPQLGAEPEFVRMFLNEARLAARLTHPNIVQIFELGNEDGSYYLAMEYIAGEDLRSLAQQAETGGSRPPLGLICRILIDVLAGLHYAHTRAGADGKPLGLVHRDITPQNILCTYEGAVKLIDFGIAKATQVRQAEQTQAGLLKGKYAYMSPEQTRGGQLDARSDVFAAGILLWELVTWRRLFKRGTDLATLVAISEEPAPAMSLINPEVPDELDQIVLKALSGTPDDRFPSAQAFQAALEECVANQGWQGDNRALGAYMRELFKDKLKAQKEEAQAAGARSVEEFLMNGGPARPSGPMRSVSGLKGLPLPTMPLPAVDLGRHKVAQRATEERGLLAAARRASARQAGEERKPGTVQRPASAANPLVQGPTSAANPPGPSSGPAPLLPPERLDEAQATEPSPRLAATDVALPASGPDPGAPSQRRHVLIAVVVGLVIGLAVVLLLSFFGKDEAGKGTGARLRNSSVRVASASAEIITSSPSRTVASMKSSRRERAPSAS